MNVYSSKLQSLQGLLGKFVAACEHATTRGSHRSVSVDLRAFNESAVFQISTLPGTEILFNLTLHAQIGPYRIVKIQINKLLSMFDASCHSWFYVSQWFEHVFQPPYMDTAHNMYDAEYGLFILPSVYMSAFVRGPSILLLSIYFSIRLSDPSHAAVN